MSADTARNSGGHLLQLSDDVLLAIFDLLPNFLDCVHFACSAQRLRDVFKLWAKPKRNQFMLSHLEELSLPNLIDFFQLSGRYIKSLYIDCAAWEKESLLVEFVCEYCQNLEEIEFCNVDDNFHFGRILARQSKLERVTIDCMESEDVLNFDLSRNQNLKYFRLINGCYTGSNLINLPNLQRLVLNECLLWNSHYFTMPMAKLKTLELQDCLFEVTNVSLFVKIAECCVELEELIFSCCDTNYDIIASLPKLKRLTMTTWLNNNEVHCSFLRLLAERKHASLEYLKVIGQLFITEEHILLVGRMKLLREFHILNNDHFNDGHLKYLEELEHLELLGLSWCSNISSTGLLLLLRKCVSLKQLELKNCHHIDDEFVLDIISTHIRPGSLHPRGPISITTFNCGITRKILQHAKYLSAVPLIKLKLLDSF